MPTIVEEGGYRFVIRTRESPVEPPHVHVLGPDGTEFRINLQDGSFMDPVPKGLARKVKRLFRKHLEAIREAWERYHPTRKIGG
jgi:hypothetical protein